MVGRTISYIHRSLYKYKNLCQHKCRLSTKIETKRNNNINDRVIPEKLFNKKHKTPDSMYIINEEAANIINKSVEPFLQNISSKTVLEINPGIGLFTKKLLDREDQFSNILLVESLDEFMPIQEELHALYPDRVKVKQGDFINLWKLSYQDKMDEGTRVENLLEYVPKAPYAETENMLVFGVVGSYNFFKYLIKSIAFQTGLLSYGRCEMFLVMPPPIYIHLTCSKDLGYLFYRATSILFQMLFEYRYITKIPREHFIPPESSKNLQVRSKLYKLKSIDTEYLYLVKIVPRQNVYKLCSPADFPALWYFVKQNCISRHNRILPNLEKWIPVCGPRLIVNSKKRKSTFNCYDDEDVSLLPQYSVPCTTMSLKDYIPNINIYTEFGDITPSQMLTLFKQFRSWPEYAQSPFLDSLESSLVKMETSENDSINGANVSEEDDISNELSYTEVQSKAESNKNNKNAQKNV